MTNETTIDWNEAARLDEKNSNFFSPETGKEYLLAFKGWKLVSKLVPDYNDKSKMVEQPVLNLDVESIDGQTVTQEWGQLGKGVRDTFKPYCENGMITTQVFKYRKIDKGGKKSHSLVVVGPKQGGEKITPAVI